MNTTTAMEVCAFDIFFEKNVPHILENILLSLDYESLKQCYEVNHTWRNFLASESTKTRAKTMFPEEILQDEMNLRHASKEGFTEDVRKLLSIGLVDVDSVDKVYGLSPLHCAVRKGHKDVIQLLLDRGADPDKADAHQRMTPLHRAAWHGHKYVVQLFLDNGEDPNKAAIHGETPLYWAALGAI